MSSKNIGAIFGLPDHCISVCANGGGSWTPTIATPIDQIQAQHVISTTGAFRARGIMRSALILLLRSPDRIWRNVERRLVRNHWLISLGTEC
jgi:hypothetical protein